MGDASKQKLDVKMGRDAIIAAAASDQPEIMHKVFDDLLGTIFFYDGIEEKKKIEKINSVIGLAQSIKPKDVVEAQLAAQMIAAHNAAMECIRRFNIPNQTTVGQEMYMKHSAKFMNLYISQMKALQKYRGQGDQKMVIEHVNVAPGGQAIVGNVTTGSQSKPQPIKAIEHTPDASADLLNKATKSRQKAKSAKSRK